LVRRLLEYKKYRDAASLLEERSRRWRERYPRLADDVPSHERDPASEPIHEVELWDLVSAFGRIMRETEAARPSSIVYDDTPIHVYMSRIHARLQEAGRLRFRDLFQPSMHKSTMIGIFLAILELVRHAQIRVDQNALFGEIWIVPNTENAIPLDLSNVDEYEHAAT
jgi:segregation and condensation protein A